MPLSAVVAGVHFTCSLSTCVRGHVLHCSCVYVYICNKRMHAGAVVLQFYSDDFIHSYKCERVCTALLVTSDDDNDAQWDS